MRALLQADVAVREATADDGGFIARLSELAFGEYDPRAQQATAKMMREPQALTLLVTRSEAPLGFVIVCPQSPGTLAINAIAVVPAERGRGIGKLLMRAAEEHARALGSRRLLLSTAQANLAALDLFLRVGFVIISRTSAHYSRRQPACKLEKRLA